MAARLDRGGVSWRLSGSAGRLLLGMSTRPADVDVEVDGADAGRAAAALGLPAPKAQHNSGWSSLRSEGRLMGVYVDLSGGLEVRGPGGVLRAGDAATVSTRILGHTVAVVAPGESVARAVVGGDGARERTARAALPADPAPALRYAESRVAAAANAAR